MKFKLKFEIVYDNIDKDILRDMKIQSLLDDVNTEVVADVPIPIPNKEDVIILKNVEYIIKGISHIVDNDSYTTLIKVVSKSYIESERRKEEELELSRMIEMFK